MYIIQRNKDKNKIKIKKTKYTFYDEIPYKNSKPPHWRYMTVGYILKI